MCFGAESFKQDGGRSSTVTSPAPVDQSPASPEAMTDRLQAAEGATGFKLADIITDRNSGSFGKVIGFGRVNLPSRPAGERVLLVQYGHDIEGVDIAILDPSDADFIATATN